MLTPGATILAGNQEESKEAAKTATSVPADQKTVISSNNNNTIVVRDGCIDITKLEKIEKKFSEKVRNKPKQNRSHNGIATNPPSTFHPAVRASPPRSRDSPTKGINMQSSTNGKGIPSSPPKEWSPADTLLHRIQEKMEYIVYYNLLDNQDIGLLQITIG